MYSPQSAQSFRGFEWFRSFFPIPAQRPEYCTAGRVGKTIGKLLGISLLHFIALARNCVSFEGKDCKNEPNLNGERNQSSEMELVGGFNGRDLEKHNQPVIGPSQPSSGAHPERCGDTSGARIVAAAGTFRSALVGHCRGAK
jgi:hypothetical protein